MHSYEAGNVRLLEGRTTHRKREDEQHGISVQHGLKTFKDHSQTTKTISSFHGCDLQSSEVCEPSPVCASYGTLHFIASASSPLAKTAHLSRYLLHHLFLTHWKNEITYSMGVPNTSEKRAGRKNSSTASHPLTHPPSHITTETSKHQWVHIKKQNSQVDKSSCHPV